MSLVRVRFYTDAKDHRPLTVSDKYPWWCTGYNADDHSVIVAYGGNEFSLVNRWPEMYGAEFETVEEITYTSRFPKPDYIK